MYNLFIQIQNLFQYISFRTFCGLFTSFFFVFFFGDQFINWARRIQKNGQPIREDGPKEHLKKKGTPTIGGALILCSIFFNSLLWCRLNNGFICCLLFVALSFGGLGAADDVLKLKKLNPNGLSAKKKFLFQIFFALVSTLIMVYFEGYEVAQKIDIPFLKNTHINLGWLFFVWSICVIVGSSNALNLTDGLDGLVTVPVIISGFCFALISYLVGHKIFANYLNISFVPLCSEIPVFLSTLIGSCLGFLWFNAPPARIFMGDTGSLAIGALLGMCAVMSKHELIWIVIGGIFVVEALSVIIQVVFYKFTKKRVFLMAPIHHHYEQKGWSESTVVVRFWIISILLALLGLITLKIR